MDENKQSHSAREPESTKGIHGDLQTMPMTTGHRRPHRSASASHARQKVKALWEAHAAMARRHWGSEGRKKPARLGAPGFRPEPRRGKADGGAGQHPSLWDAGKTGNGDARSPRFSLRTAGETHLSNQGTPTGGHQSYRLQPYRRRPDFWRQKQNLQWAQAPTTTTRTTAPTPSTDGAGTAIEMLCGVSRGRT